MADRIELGPQAAVAVAETAILLRLARAARLAGEVVERDAVYWEREACGQDSQEAENSGYIIGFAAGLEVAALLARGDGRIEDHPPPAAGDEDPSLGIQS